LGPPFRCYEREELGEKKGKGIGREKKGRGKRGKGMAIYREMKLKTIANDKERRG
jgi:hypothetical protein